MSTVSGPSLGYGFFESPFKLLILGDYHTTSPENSLPSFLEKVSAKHDIDVYIEDVEFIGITSDMANIFAQQRKANCKENVCSPLQSATIHPNGTRTGKENTLRGTIEFLFMCGKDDRICPLKNGNVYRVDLRAQLLVNTGGVITQFIDNRAFDVLPSTFVEKMKRFATSCNSQFISIETQLPLALTKRVCQVLDELLKSLPKLHSVLLNWWVEMVETAYSPWLLNESFIFSEEYNAAWKSFGSSREKKKDLLHLISTNALMDLTTIAQMLRNDCMAPGKRVIVYVGCAHAEIIADFFKKFGICENAIENEFKLKPARKTVHFATDLSAMFS